MLQSKSEPKWLRFDIQRSDKGAGTRRARYNSALLDANVTDPGDDLQNLPETYVIFITENDVLKKGNLSYNIGRMYRVEGTNTYETFHDGAHIIYVNGAHGDVSSELGKLMADFREKDPAKMHYKTLKKGKLFQRRSERLTIKSQASK